MNVYQRECPCCKTTQIFNSRQGLWMAKKYNIVLEYDSKYHQKINQKQKDLVRQNKIIEILRPNKFWRYDSTNKKFKSII